MIRGLIEENKMGYALFAQRKLVLDMQLNCAQLQQTQRSNEQYNLAVHNLGLQQQLSSQQASQAGELAAEYEKLSKADDENERAKIDATIQKLMQKHKQENDAINQEIYQVGVKEQAIELEVKRLDTMVTALQKQLEAVEDAEGKAIDRATPKFKGLG